MSFTFEDDENLARLAEALTSGSDLAVPYEIRRKRSVTAMYEMWGDGETTMTGWVVDGCGCPWQACRFASFEDALTHALTCPISV